MSKTDELLKRALINWSNNIPQDDLMFYIKKHLHRKGKLVVGSEWVCDVECYATNGNKTYRIRKNKELTITFFEEDGYNVYFDFYDDVLDASYLKNTNKFKFDEVKTSCVIPTEQFLVCFSPKEVEV